MQFKSYLEIFDTAQFTSDHPVSPEGLLFTYYPSEEPSNMHYHNFLELGYCEKGSGVFMIDGEVITFNGKCTSIIYGGQVHIAKSVSKDKSLWHFLYVDLTKLFNGFEANMLKRLKAMKFRNYDFPNVISFSADSELYELCRSIMSESAECKEDYLVSLQGLVYSLLVKHSRYFKPKGEEVSDERTALAEELGNLLNYIAANYMEDVTIGMLTETARMSKASLQRKMLEFVGMSPMQYIHHIRLNQAALMLLDKKKNISEIATEIGYNSLSSFNRKFLKKFGMSPSDWKKLQNSLDNSRED